MSKIKNILIAIIVLTLLSSNATYADVMNPEYLTKKCKPGETEVIAHYESEKPFGPTTYDETTKYENDPSYYYLVSHGSSFGGNVKYCKKVGAVDINWTNYIIATGVGVAIVATISLVLLVKIRKKNGHK